MSIQRIGPERAIIVVMSRAATVSGLRLTALLAAAILLAQLHPRGRPATVCLLRRITGVPCPFCGGTTAAVHVGRADLLGALRASPLAVVGAALLAVRPLARDAVQGVPPGLRVAALVVALAGSELWQLHRFGWV